MFSVHWLALTLFLDAEKVVSLWRDYFYELGDFIEKEHGARGYKRLAEALLGAKMYFDHHSAEDGGAYHCHIEIPGKACETLPMMTYQDFIEHLKRNKIKFKITRADFAFDGAGFSPEQFLSGLLSDNLVSLIKRNESAENENIRMEQSPRKLRENGEVGTTTVYAGSRSSERMVRVYNMRGETRLEFQMRDKRAHAVFLDVFDKEDDQWGDVAKSHLRQFIDFKNIYWWGAFISKAERANLKVSSARQITFNRAEKWIDRQVIPFLSVYHDVLGRVEANARLNEYMTKARKYRDRSRYKSILQLAQENVAS